MRYLGRYQFIPTVSGYLHRMTRRRLTGDLRVVRHNAISLELMLIGNNRMYKCSGILKVCLRGTTLCNFQSGLFGLISNIDIMGYCGYLIFFVPLLYLPSMEASLQIPIFLCIVCLLEIIVGTLHLPIECNFVELVCRQVPTPIYPATK